MARVRLAARALQALAQRAARVRATRPAAVNALKQAAGSSRTNRAVRYVTPGSTPSRNTAGAVRKAYPPKDPKVFRARNNVTGQVERVKTPNSGESRVTRRKLEDQNTIHKKLNSATKPRLREVAVPPKPGVRLGGDPTKPGAAPIRKNLDTQRPGTIQNKRGAQANARATSQGIRAAGGIPAARSSGAPRPTPARTTNPQPRVNRSTAPQPAAPRTTARPTQVAVTPSRNGQGVRAAFPPAKPTLGATAQGQVVRSPGNEATRNAIRSANTTKPNRVPNPTGVIPTQRGPKAGGAPYDKYGRDWNSGRRRTINTPPKDGVVKATPDRIRNQAVRSQGEIPRAYQPPKQARPYEFGHSTQIRRADGSVGQVRHERGRYNGLSPEARADALRRDDYWQRYHAEQAKKSKIPGRR
jgi:hypothetical protein